MSTNSNELVPAEVKVDPESLSPSQEQVNAFQAAFKASWCLKRLIAEISENPSGDSVQRLYESSGKVYLSAPRAGFKCFADGCPVQIQNAHEWAESPNELPGCTVEDSITITEVITDPALEQ
jgi:hypothetical protein